MRAFFKKTHLWLGIPAGIIFTLLCLTGAVLVFQQEILMLAYPSHYKVADRNAAVMPLDQIVERVNKQLESRGDKIKQIQVSSNPQRPYIATLESGGRSHAYIDPATAQIKGYYNYREGFFAEMTRLHRWLMFKEQTVGRTIVGVSTIFFIVVLISGFAVWLPRRGAPKKPNFRIKWRAKSWRRTFDLHRVLGFYASALLLFMCLTGLMWSFEWYRNGVTALFGVEASVGAGERGGGDRGGRAGGERKQKQTERAVAKDGQISEQQATKEDVAEKQTPSTLWQTTLEAMQREVGEDYQYITVTGTGEATVLAKSAPHVRANDRYKIDTESGTVAPVSIYKKSKNSSYVMTWAYVLHVGAFGGFITKLLWFVAALIGATLPTTGYILLAKRLRQKKRKNARCSGCKVDEK